MLCSIFICTVQFHTKHWLGEQNLPGREPDRVVPLMPRLGFKLLPEVQSDPGPWRTQALGERGAGRTDKLSQAPPAQIPHSSAGPAHKGNLIPRTRVEQDGDP